MQGTFFNDLFTTPTLRETIITLLLEAGHLDTPVKLDAKEKL